MLANTHRDGITLVRLWRIMAFTATLSKPTDQTKSCEPPTLPSLTASPPRLLTHPTILEPLPSPTDADINGSVRPTTVNVAKHPQNHPVTIHHKPHLP